MPAIRDKLFGLSAKKRVPITGAFELTPVCNFQCKMCYVRKSAGEVSEMGGLQPLAFWLEVAEQAKNAGTLSPLLTGGETFLYPYIRELYQAMYKMGMEISINSNGSCITKDTAEWLREMPPSRINITLYGGSNETYGRLCGDPNGLDKVRRGVDLLVQNKIRFKFNCSLMPENAGDLKAMLDFAHSYGMGLRVATYMFPPARRIGHETEFLERLTPQECAYYQVLSDWYQLTPEQFCRLAVNAGKYQELTSELLAEAAEKPAQKMGCLSGRCSYWVDWQGNLSGCGMMDYPKVSLKDESFHDAWQQIVEWTNNARYSSYCGNCVNKQICYVCAAMVYNETGGFNGRPVYLCEKAKYTAQYYKKFMEKLPADVTAASTDLVTAQPESCVFDEN